MLMILTADQFLPFLVAGIFMGMRSRAFFRSADQFRVLRIAGIRMRMSSRAFLRPADQFRVFRVAGIGMRMRSRAFFLPTDQLRILRVTGIGMRVCSLSFFLPTDQLFVLRIAGVRMGMRSRAFLRLAYQLLVLRIAGTRMDMPVRLLQRTGQLLRPADAGVRMDMTRIRIIADQRFFRHIAAVVMGMRLPGLQPADELPVLIPAVFVVRVIVFIGHIAALQLSVRVVAAVSVLMNLEAALEDADGFRLFLPFFLPADQIFLIALLCMNMLLQPADGFTCMIPAFGKGGSGILEQHGKHAKEGTASAPCIAPSCPNSSNHG